MFSSGKWIQRVKEPKTKVNLSPYLCSPMGRDSSSPAPERSGIRVWPFDFYLASIPKNHIHLHHSKYTRASLRGPTHYPSPHASTRPTRPKSPPAPAGRHPLTQGAALRQGPAQRLRPTRPTRPKSPTAPAGRHPLTQGAAQRSRTAQSTPHVPHFPPPPPHS